MIQYLCDSRISRWCFCFFIFLLFHSIQHRALLLGVTVLTEARVWLNYDRHLDQDCYIPPTYLHLHNYVSYIIPHKP